MAQQMKGFATKPQLNTQNPHGKGREITPRLFSDLHTCLCTCVHTNTQYIHTPIKNVKKELKSYPMKTGDCAPAVWGSSGS